MSPSHRFVIELHALLEEDPLPGRFLLPLEPLLTEAYRHRFSPYAEFWTGEEWRTPLQVYEVARDLCKNCVNCSSCEENDVPTGGKKK